ncbi:hypothetical protein [Mailhella massiliensis]|uniref:Tetratricopeptide repeat protein n=1 Tax=Mailhella massiliensis TaxID=1903261 RepID=A0A921DQN9_9BACT|nr:hypothetical protein [Mailhella massiliensis]HJD96694.1 hypothetical protein [Mailhella massiliensis]
MGVLQEQQRRTLHVLGYMMLRMGQQARAGRIYAALAALAPGQEPDRLALAGLAALAIDEGQGAKALEYLRGAMSGRVLSSRQAALHLMKAQALWLEGRREEARAALDEYLFLAGGGKNA